MQILSNDYIGTLPFDVITYVTGKVSLQNWLNFVRCKIQFPFP
jgi:hypothetical protein